MRGSHEEGSHCKALHENRAGFTLLELIIVLLILGFTAGIVIPRIGASSKRMSEREFLQSFVQTIRRARLQAMNSGKMVSFRIRSADRHYGLHTPPEKPIPTNVDIYADDLEVDPQTQDHLIVFYPDGSVVGSRMEIVFDKTRHFRVSVNPLLGTVKWSKSKSQS